MKYKTAYLAFFKSHKKGIIKAVVGIVILTAALFFYLYESEQAGELTVINEGSEVIDEQEITTSPQSISNESVDIIIDIGGAVANPGIIKLNENGRVYEAVEKAGGLTAEADVGNINLAEKLSDGDKVWIPFIIKQQQTTAQISAPSSAVVSGSTSAVVKPTGETQNAKVNLNTADTVQLQTLKGVGPSMADKIINYREKNGGFKTIDDLKEVSGIGDKTFEKLKEFVTV